MGSTRWVRFYKWFRAHARTLLGSGLALLAFGVTAFVAFWASSSKPPSSAQSLVFVFVAGILQAASAIVFERSGKGNPGVARRALERLLILRLQVAAARERIEIAREAEKLADLRNAIGVASVELGYIEQGIASGVQDWVEFIPKEEEMKVVDQ